MTYNMPMNMNEKIEEIVRTSALLSKLKHKDKSFVQKIKKEYLKDILNEEKALLFIFYNWFLAKHDESINQYNNESSFAVMNDILVVIDNLLDNNPNNWLIRILKNKMQSLSYENEMIIIEDLKELINTQNKNEESMPYSILPLLMISENYYSLADKEKAIHYLNKIHLQEKDKIKVIPDFFKSFFHEYSNKLNISREYDMANKVRLIETSYF